MAGVEASMATTRNSAPAPTLLAVRDLAKTYPVRQGILARLGGGGPRTIRALNGVSFDIPRGQTLGLIGESGCGKSTLGRTVLRLHEPSGGTALLDGIDLMALPPARLKALRRRMQMVFQDPYASLNPRHRVADIVGLPLRVHEQLPRTQERERVVDIIEKVGLSPAHLQRYPHQFSGGQRQRIGIARALVSRPDFVVCDEPVSALDVSVQAQILRLLLQLKAEFGLTYLFISHDIAVVAQVSDRVAVMYLGEIVESAATRDLLTQPGHPYTQALLSAVPRVDAPDRRTRLRLAGELPSPLDPPSGCKFHPRCPHATPHCRRVAPKPVRVAAGHTVACHLYGGIA
jgi:oligopeptide/dipeptide ABC transporter ATP-binding protein